LGVFAGVERTEVSSAIFSAGDDLTIDDGALAGQRQKSITDLWSWHR